MSMFLKITFTSFLIYFSSWFVLYKLNINTLPIQSEDTVSTIFTTVSLVENNSFYLDEYYQMMVQKYPHPDDQDYQKGLTPFYLKKVDNRYLSAFPLITSIISVPVFYLPLKLGLVINWDNLIILTHVASSLIMSVSVYFFYILLKNRYKLSKDITNYLTIIFAFGTINFSMFSQGLWQYSTLQLFLILGLYFSDSKNLFLSGLFSGIAVLTRPTAVLPIIFYPFLKYRYFKLTSLYQNINYFLQFVSGLIPSILFFIWYNNLFYKDISNQGYAAQAFNSWLSQFPEGFLGIWISPSKGILIFSPVFIFVLYSMFIIFKDFFDYFKTKSTNNPILKFLSFSKIHYLSFLIIVILHTFVMGFWKHWYGGYGFGYRMAGDVIPFLVLLLIPFIQSQIFNKYKKIFFTLLFLSVLIQFYGLVFFDSIWHLAYDKGFSDTSWLWSLQDSEWAFNFRRVLVKIGFLERACPVCLPN